MDSGSHGLCSGPMVPSPGMKVTGLKTFLFQPPDAKTACFLKIDTDAGISGWGEAYTLTGREPTLERLVQDLGEFLIGRDPFQIKHFMHAMWRDLSIKRGRPRRAGCRRGC